MNRYYVEFINEGFGNGKNVCIYVNAYSPEQVKEMFDEYILIACDQRKLTRVKLFTAELMKLKKLENSMNGAMGRK